MSPCLLRTEVGVALAMGGGWTVYMSIVAELDQLYLKLLSKPSFEVEVYIGWVSLILYCRDSAFFVVQ